jgi:dTDP-4-dehydrorhamnose 3,5-epimerase-like enzyme
MDVKIKGIKKVTDKRGDLGVLFSGHDIHTLPFGQIWYITFEGNGVVRGGHYHKTWSEWFCPIVGSVLIELRDIKTNEYRMLVLSAEIPEKLYIGPYIEHTFTSLSKQCVIINYANKPWNKKDVYKVKGDI